MILRATMGVSYDVYTRHVTAGQPTFTRLPLAVACCGMTAGYLRNNHTYAFRVTAVGPGGQSSVSNTVRATPRR